MAQGCNEVSETLRATELRAVTTKFSAKILGKLDSAEISISLMFCFMNDVGMHFVNENDEQIEKIRISITDHKTEKHGVKKGIAGNHLKRVVTKFQAKFRANGVLFEV